MVWSILPLKGWASTERNKSSGQTGTSMRVSLLCDRVSINNDSYLIELGYSVCLIDYRSINCLSDYFRVTAAHAVSAPAWPQDALPSGRRQPDGTDGRYQNEKAVAEIA